MIDGRALALGTCAFGRAIDAGGVPLDDKPPLAGRRVGLELRSPTPNERGAVSAPLWTGLRVLDGLLTIGRGARVGIFGAPGAGKTTLLETIVEGCAADAVVVALAGERGREAQRWIVSPDERTTVVCATGDRPAQERVMAARVALVHAAALRERGLHVLVVLDSLARVAAAARELAVAAGESTGRGGYPPSVFSSLARLVEVAGVAGEGSITLIATVLGDGDDRDPVSDAARSILDGHVALSLRLAHAGCFPAVDVPASTSRTMELVVDGEQLRAAAALRRALALFDRIDDALALGIEPADPASRRALAARGAIERFLRQGRERSEPAATVSQLLALANRLTGDDGDR